MPFYGKLYRFCRFIVRRFYPDYRIAPAGGLRDPAVYLCRHFDTKGVFMTIPWLSGKIHPWSLDLYHDRKACYRHMVNYTLTERFGWPRWKARLVALPIAGFLPRLMRSARAIPVYRKSMKILQTYRLSLDALIKGESLLIFPDRDYTSMERSMGDMYEGFLAIERLYKKATGRHVSFIPLFAEAQTRILHVGEAVCFSDDLRNPLETARVYQTIKRQLSGIFDEDSPAAGRTDP